MQKISNMTSSKGNKIANQFIIENASFELDGKTLKGRAFQSYDSTIAFMSYCGVKLLSKSKWDYSRTTGKYRNSFLNEGIQETREKIRLGLYKLVELD